VRFEGAVRAASRLANASWSTSRFPSLPDLPEGEEATGAPVADWFVEWQSTRFPEVSGNEERNDFLCKIADICVTTFSTFGFVRMEANREA
jgi:hypothetical protein